MFSRQGGLLHELQLAGGLSRLESLFLETTIARAGFDLAAQRRGAAVPVSLDPHAEHRERILYALDKLEQVPNLPSPKLVFAHIISPHPPMVFGANGEPVNQAEFETEPGAGRDIDLLLRAYADQVQFLNGQLLEVVDAILAASDQPPIIIIQGDHGRADRNPEDKLSILNAFHLPAGGSGGLYPTITKERHFPSRPGRLLGIGWVTTATAHPMLWTLNSPRIYEAAIASGQAFLIGGLYAALPILDGSGPRPRRAAIAGTLWAFAIGSLLLLLLPVALLALGTAPAAIRCATPGSARRRLTTTLGSIAIALAIGSEFLALYNLSRFGDPLETGLSYIFTAGNVGQQIARGHFFSLAYLPPALLYHLAAPLRLMPQLPFVRPHWVPYPPFTQFPARLETSSAWGMECGAPSRFDDLNPKLYRLVVEVFSP